MKFIVMDSKVFNKFCLLQRNKKVPLNVKNILCFISMPDRGMGCQIGEMGYQIGHGVPDRERWCNR